MNQDRRHRERRACRQRLCLAKVSDYRSRRNVRVRVLDFVQFGGPKWMVGSTVFEMWLGNL